MFEEAISRVRSLLATDDDPIDFGLVLTGGGARAAYQAGVIRYISDHIPTAQFSILVGVSAGAINAAHLANHVGPLQESATQLAENWRQLRSKDVFEMESTYHVVKAIAKQAVVRGGNHEGSIAGLRALAHTDPLRETLIHKFNAENGQMSGVAERLSEGTLKAAAIVTTSYTTGQTVTWVQGSSVDSWERPNRISINTSLTVEHIMASTSLPFLFPAVEIGDAWYGDGGIRLSSPLAPAIHLGAERILAISTRYSRTRAEADRPVVEGYPPAAQIFGILTNAVFLDALDQDALILDRVNNLLDQLPRRKWMGLRPVQLLLLRPSVDLGKLAREYEATLPTALEIFSRTLGTGETRSPDWLSLLLFEYEYISRLIDIGYEDARRQHHTIEEFFDTTKTPLSGTRIESKKTAENRQRQ